jgi:hypothetical protein
VRQTWLYEHMTAPTPALTASAKGLFNSKLRFLLFLMQIHSPQVKFMHSLVIQVGGVCKFILGRRRRTYVLLLIHDKVLGTSNYTSVLDTLDGLSHGHSSQDWVRTEA